MDHSQEAVRLFYEGYNCSQAVFCAFRDLTGLELDCAARLASPFGGGMGRLEAGLSGGLRAKGGRRLRRLPGRLAALRRRLIR